MLTPVIDELAEENKDKYVIGKVNVDECPDIAAKYGIRSIPCLLYFKDGKVEKQSVGVVDKNEIQISFRKYLISEKKYYNSWKWSIWLYCSSLCRKS